MGALRFARGPARAIAPPHRHRRLAWIAGIAAVLLLVAGLALRVPLADAIWPENRLQALRAQAAQALARGHLTAGDGTGARELYAAAIAIDPDSADARAGLARVGLAALAQARAAAARDDFATAGRALALARELQAPRAQANAVAATLRAREAGVAGVDTLLARAATAHGNGHLDGDPAAALPLYQRVLALQPRRIQALEGREDALSELLRRAQAKIATGDVEGAARGVAAARRYDAGHVDLPQVEGELSRALEALRQRADRDLRRGALDRAATGYLQLRAIDPGDATAARGIAALADAHAARAVRAAADFDFAAARAALARARALAPDAPSVAQAARRIDDARRARARLPAAPVDRATARRVAVLLQEADAAQAAGNLTTPPGESAYDKLRAARALAPSASEVRRAQARIAPAARQCYERELPRNDLGRARACLDAWAALDGEGRDVRAARSRLAQRWVAVGGERLGAGDIAGAGAALRAAEAIDRAAPGIAGFRERLRAAAPSGG